MTSTAIVTGAGGGIGAATVARLAADGVRVIATDVAGATPAIPTNARYVPFDLLDGDPSQLMAALDGNPLDYLVNAAGVALFDRDGSSLDAQESVWDLTMGVNLHGVRRLITAAVPYLREGCGKSIVNVASIAARPELNEGRRKT